MSADVRAEREKSERWTSLSFHTLDVFTDHLFGGNQLAVFPEAPDLSAHVMQSIAREFNLSETVFVRPPERAGALRKVRIFTPGSELPFAGHPTIGTAQLLFELGIATATAGETATFALEENVGLVPVEVTRGADGQFFTWLTSARLPECGRDVPAPDVIAACLGLSRGDLLVDDRDAPVAYSVGLPFLFVPVRDRAALARAELDPARWREAFAATPAKDVYIFCREPDGTDPHFRARMFGPGVSITEDPATGSAAAAFAGYLWRRDGAAGRWVIAQGVEMGRPSRLHLEIRAESGKLVGVRVGGSAVRVSSGSFRLAD